MSEQTARDRFVEAMRWLWNRADSKDDEVAIKDAVEAFADAECAYRRCPTCPAFNSDMNVNYHAACRAALLRECGLEE